MSAEWLSAAASSLTLVLILASAIAALLQMRHMRNGNQILALTEVRETMESPEFRAALAYVLRDLPMLMQDTQARQHLLEIPLPKEFQQARWVATFFENLGVFVKHGALGRAITCDMWGATVLVSWERLAPMIANRRYVTNNHAIFENFEYLAVICRQFKNRHPNGTYPHRLGRMPTVERWPEAK